jgi:hypothetical protein
MKGLSDFAIALLAIFALIAAMMIFLATYQHGGQRMVQTFPSQHEVFIERPPSE